MDDGFNSQGKGSTKSRSYSACVNADHWLPAHEQVWSCPDCREFHSKFASVIRRAFGGDHWKRIVKYERLPGRFEAVKFCLMCLMLFEHAWMFDFCPHLR